MAKELDTIREIKELAATKKKLETAKQAVMIRQEDFNDRLVKLEKKFGVDDLKLISLGRIAGKYFGMTITPEKLDEELAFIFIDSDISDYVSAERGELPFAEELSELDKVLYGKLNVSAKANKHTSESHNDDNEKSDSNSATVDVNAARQTGEED